MNLDDVLWNLFTQGRSVHTITKQETEMTTKFKVGDRVKWVDDGTYENGLIKCGSLGTVIGSSEYHSRVRFDGATGDKAHTAADWRCGDNNYELVHTPKVEYLVFDTEVQYFDEARYTSKDAAVAAADEKAKDDRDVVYEVLECTVVARRVGKTQETVVVGEA